MESRHEGNYKIEQPKVMALKVTNLVDRYFSIRGEKSAALSEPMAINVPINPNVVTPLSNTFVAIKALNN